jgi:hypothetical protein
MSSLRRRFVLIPIAKKQFPNTTATIANYGTMLPVKTSITAMTAVFAGLERDLAKITFIARNAMSAWPSLSRIIINVLKEIWKVTVQYAENTCLPLQPQSYLW